MNGPEPTATCFENGRIHGVGRLLAKQLNVVPGMLAGMPFSSLSHQTLGYCTNVHAGTDLATIQANLAEHALPVKEMVSPNKPMGIGLWFAQPAAMELIADPDRLAGFKDWLQDNGLLPYTVNGFPYGNFHEPVVKHAVYEPNWADPRRAEYTLALAVILADLLPDGENEGSISTLPIGWRADIDWQGQKAAAHALNSLVHQLARIELNTGKMIHINLEPEPGCFFDTSEDVVDYFRGHLLGGLDDVSVKSYLRVCHDVCHSAVMFEPQAHAMAVYRQAGVNVGKVQLSSAIAVDFESMNRIEQEAALDELEAFAEDRYMHQTCVRLPSGAIGFFEDLPLALEQAPLEGEWRIHFHVPVHAEKLGCLGTTQKEVLACFQALQGSDEIPHFEVETYAWMVLPEHLHPVTLSDGVARELQWVKDHLPGPKCQG